MFGAILVCCILAYFMLTMFASLVFELESLWKIDYSKFSSRLFSATLSPVFFAMLITVGFIEVCFMFVALFFTWLFCGMKVVEMLLFRVTSKVFRLWEAATRKCCVVTNVDKDDYLTFHHETEDKSNLTPMDYDEEMRLRREEEALADAEE